MSGLITVDQKSTFAAPPIVMAVSPRLKFGTTEQDITRDGERRWTVQAAVSYIPEPDGKPQAEVIEITLTGEDPSAKVSTGMQVSFTRLRLGVSSPEQRDNGRGGTRVVGGKVYWLAESVSPYNASANGNGRPAAAVKAE